MTFQSKKILRILLSGALSFLFRTDEVQAVKLTKSSWEEHVSGKKVFIKFFSPTCTYCKKMKRAWKYLMEDYETSDHVLIAHVDCTHEGRSLCKKHNIQGFPTLKFGDPANLEDYEGRRDYDSLKSFVVRELEPRCSPDLIHLCNQSQRERIEDYMTMDVKDLDDLIEEAMVEKEAEDELFDELLEELEDKAQQFQEERDRVISTVTPVLNLLKEVRRTISMKENTLSPGQREV